LFYRLNVIPFFVPPLRERKEDVPLLARHFLKEFAAAYGRRSREITDDAIQMLMRYSWPGNVRELRNAIERALVFSGGASLIPEDFPENVRAAESAFGGALRSLDDLERDAIRATLEATHYKIGKSAQILGISRKTLLDKRKKYGLN
jgi:DNA-binding NtrC family response regulator